MPAFHQIYNLDRNANALGVRQYSCTFPPWISAFILRINLQDLIGTSIINYKSLKYKSLGQAFSKACGVQRQSLGRSSQWAKSPVQTAKLSNHKANCQRSWQFAFVRRALRKGVNFKTVRWTVLKEGASISSNLWFDLKCQCKADALQVRASPK